MKSKPSIKHRAKSRTSRTTPDRILTPTSYQPSADALAQRVVLVTGANSGIGRAVACACAQAGATVVLLARNIPRLEEVYDEIQAAGGPEPAIYPLDMNGATADDYIKMAERIDADFGRLDGILNNAGLVGGLRPLRLFEVEEWMQLMRINLLAPWLLTQACLPLLDRAPDPAIVFALDRHARHAYWGAYGVAKSGLEGLVQILAEELDGDHRIRVNGIDPGAVETRLRRQNYPGASGDAYPTPEVVAPAYVYFLGTDSRDITGQIIQLD